MALSISVLTLYLQLPGCTSLKQKRGLIKPVLARLHREFNVSSAEVDKQDMWQEAVLACALVSSDSVHNQRVLQQVIAFTEENWPNLILLDARIERI